MMVVEPPPSPLPPPPQLTLLLMLLLMMMMMFGAGLLTAVPGPQAHQETVMDALPHCASRHLGEKGWMLV